MATLANRIAIIEEQHTLQAEPLRVPPFTPPLIFTPDPANTPERPKPRLPKPDKFDGKDTALYP
jgi:hypothetical protein